MYVFAFYTELYCLIFNKNKLRDINLLDITFIYVNLLMNTKNMCIFYTVTAYFAACLHAYLFARKKFVSKKVQNIQPLSI